MAIRNDSTDPIHVSRGSVVAHSKYSFITEDNQHKNILRGIKSSRTTIDSSPIPNKWYKMWKEEAKGL